MTVEGSTSHNPIVVNESTPVLLDLSHIGPTQAEPFEHAPSYVSNTSNSVMPRSVQTSTLTSRTPRPRINTNRTRPYHDASSRASASRKSSTPCKYFLSGSCFASDTCRYQHILAPPAQATEELDQQLLAFVSENASAPPGTDETEQVSPEDPSPSSALTPTAPGVEDGTLEYVLSDDEELYEIVPHPENRVAELRYHSTLHPNESRTYFVAQRQAVVGYEGNNVGVLSGGVLLGVPCALQPTGLTARAADGDISEPVYGSEATGSSYPSSISNGSDVELWKGAVNFGDNAAADHLDWADDEFTQDMEGVEPTFCSVTPPSVLPTPPPVIRRIIRNSEGHNRRHSLS
ncbi:hypothetical protein FRC08_004562 [Ceratobasidium sp. 394]|nr:hypothetical protein FRC08_004562 [Ceratobasidium sp. 394]KAG9092502.1 hypothetical protein FS749_015676 [Ceratobasidium sp. UAMH 11750]